MIIHQQGICRVFNSVIKNGKGISASACRRHENTRIPPVLHANINDWYWAISAGRWFFRVLLKILLLFFSVAAVEISLLTDIPILDRGGGLRGSKRWRGRIGDFHRAPLNVWVVMVTCEEFPSLTTIYRQNVLNLKWKCRKMSLARFFSFAERLRLFPLRLFDAQAYRQVVIESCARFS